MRAHLFTLVLSILSLSTKSLSQEFTTSLSATCGTLINGKMTYSGNQIRTSALFLRIRDSIISKQNRRHSTSIVNNTNETLSDTSTLYTIPIVVHIIMADPFSITDNMVIAAIEELNQAFAHQAAYSLDTNGVNSRIRFCLAKEHPSGGLTTGITRTVSFYRDNDADLEPFKTAALNNWNPNRYLNLWLVDAIQGEIMPSSFSCGSWNRMGMAGYASAGVGAVVNTLGVPLVAHEVGHYLSLLHTFAGGCTNNDCTLDGDLVCDTPPDGTTAASPCNNPENSCTTDILSGPFTVDVRDNISNFMDYGSPCPTVFTKGQAERMRTFLEGFNNGSLIDSTPCLLPCQGTMKAYFDWSSNQYPITGDSVRFQNASVDAHHYEWYVNSVLIDSTINFGYRFNTAGTYEVLLRAYNADSTCYATYSANLLINCGVVARFSPNKRIISSQAGVYSDPVTFVNKSHGGSIFKWYITSPGSSTPALIATTRDLIYDFPQPGGYSIFLEAIDGTCVSRSSSFNLTVLDPIPDGSLNFKEVDCYKKDSIRVVVEIVNRGFDTIPAGMVVTFYDRDPRTPGAVRLLNNYITDQYILGNCSILFTHIVAASRHRLDTIFAFFDENSTISESSYANNITGTSEFQFRLWVTPTTATVYTNTDQSITLNSYKGPPVNIRWNSIATPSCQTCLNPTFRIIDTTRIQGYGENIYACPDSGVAIINVIPLDALISLDSVCCYKNDSMLVKVKVCLGNNYTSIKRDLKIDFYDRDTLSVGKIFLGSGIIPFSTNFSTLCQPFTYIIKMTNSRRVYAYLNSDLQQFENTTSNNVAFIDYTPLSINFPSPVIEVFRGVSYPIQFNREGDSIHHILWTPSASLSCSTCFTPFVKTNVSQTLKLNVATFYQCTDSAVVDIKAFYQSHISLPNVFTPNGDGVNDNFYVIAGKDVVKINLFQVLNRWGEKVFEVTNAEPNTYKYGWDGTKNNNPMPQGTYVYYIVVELTDGRKETYKGNVTVIR